MLLDNSGYLPTFKVLTDGNTHDIKVARQLPTLSPDSMLLVDRAYIDYKWLYSLTQKNIFFVTRTKRNMKCNITGQQKHAKNNGVLSDCHVQLANYYQCMNYPEYLRLVTVIDPQTGQELTFMTNNFELNAEIIAELYKSRWEIETFFRWIKQNLKIKSFLGTSKNAVMTQIWAAMIYYLMLSFIKFQTKCRHSLHELTRIVAELLLDTTYLVEILTISFNKFKIITQKQGQLSLF